MASRTQFRLWGEGDGACGIVSTDFFRSKAEEKEFAKKDLGSDEEFHKGVCVCGNAVWQWKTQGCVSQRVKHWPALVQCAYFFSLIIFFDLQ